MALNLDPLVAAVTEEETVDDSFIALVNQIQDLNKTAVASAIAATTASDAAATAADTAAAQSAIDGVTSRLVSSASKVSAAIVANTPAAPTP